MKPRREAYARFYATYDINADYERMKKTGVFQSQQMIEEAGEE